MFAIYLLVVLLLIMFVTIYRESQIKTKRCSVAVNRPQSCRMVIAAGAMLGTGMNKLGPLHSRAIPNNRIHRVFGIENAFTSTDVKYVEQFVGLARRLVNLKPSDWERLSQVTFEALQRWLVGSSSIHLESLIQVLSLRATLLALSKFSDPRLCQVRDTDILDLARAINHTWISSKRGEERPFAENHILQASIQAIFLDRDLRTPKDNPLNLIIPGFETLWRVVLRGYVEIGFLAGRQHPEWRQMLAAFAQGPTREQFLWKHGEDSISCEDLVNEVLRLYPPTRRIHRTYKSDMAAKSIGMAADLEACHRLNEIWGTDAMDYDPRRWRRLEKAQKEAFMPFGSTPFECPARPIFGPRIIGLLIGTLFREICGDWVLKLHGRGFPDPSVPIKRLSNERSALSEAYLSR
ncbi:hypothetical protein BDW59DRAFT_157928 [Aspergillus cavernicola]|uniref:Cytochrome P450 n=1 Tax=Aspergillus cavernicola TaxID=176166 RepID=A0ABR4IUQ6_9EURO